MVCVYREFTPLRDGALMIQAAASAYGKTRNEPCQQTG
jgi:hypothetical protein